MRDAKENFGLSGDFAVKRLCSDRQTKSQIQQQGFQEPKLKSLKIQKSTQSNLKIIHKIFCQQNLTGGIIFLSQQ